jgi:hypothetical protein
MVKSDRFYEIDFTNGSDVKTLRYQIIDSPVADAWWNIVQGALASPDCHISNNQWIHNAPNDSIDALWERMKLLIDELNTGRHGQLPQLVMPAQFNPNIDYSDILNYLHLQFHEFSEQKQNHTTDYTPISELNVLIHKIEAVLQQGPMSCGFYLDWQFSTEAPRVINIEDTELYQHWTSARTFGDIMLGYHTIGKNLWMCYKDNDVDLVKSGMFRQQQTISNEVNLIFRSDLKRYSKNNNFLFLCKWLDDNNLTQYVDMTKPYNCAIGQPLLGKLTGTYTSADIGQILSLGRVGTVRLL